MVKILKYKKYAHWESNSNHDLRRVVLYPLSYGRIMKPISKPSSVLDNHLSWTIITYCLQRSVESRRAASNLSVELAFCRGLPQEYLSIFRVVFYTTVAPEPLRVVYFSVALSSPSPIPDVIRRPALECSDFPHTTCSVARDYPIGFIFIISWIFLKCNDILNSNFQLTKNFDIMF